MEMKQISDSTLKITIKMDDLEERGMELADFLIPQEKTEEFFYTVLDELDLPSTFRESGMLSFRVTPKPDKIDIFVTKSDIDQNLDFSDFADLAGMDDVSQLSSDEFLKTLEKSIREKSANDEEAVRLLEEAEEMVQEGVEAVEENFRGQPAYEHSDYVYYILAFSSVKEAVQFAHVVSFDIDTSELYKMNGAYYLTVLVDVQNRSKEYPTYLLSRMKEHAEEAMISRAVLQEHGFLLLQPNAVEELRKVHLA